jgi:sugar phosphate isomerase/epimerase
LDVRYVMFTKHLQTMSVREAGETIKSLGFDGVELTVRPGGHVLPQNVDEELPRAVETLGEIGLSVPALVVEIHNRGEEYAAAVCRAAGRAGATVLRTRAPATASSAPSGSRSRRRARTPETWRAWARSSGYASASTPTRATS